MEFTVLQKEQSEHTSTSVIVFVCCINFYVLYVNTKLLPRCILLHIYLSKSAIVPKFQSFWHLIYKYFLPSTTFVKEHAHYFCNKNGRPWSKIKFPENSTQVKENKHSLNLCRTTLGKFVHGLYNCIKPCPNKFAGYVKYFLNT